MKRHLMLVALVASLGLTSQVRAGGGVLLYTENFNSVTLGDSVNERLGFPTVTAVATDPNSVPIPNAFTHTGPAGWTVDNNWNNFGNPAGDLNGGVDLDNPEHVTADIVGNIGVLNQGDPANGVEEWEGWSFANKDFWVETAGGQDRELFTLGVGTVAIADGDEYNDLGAGFDGSYMNTGMTTASINVSAFAGAPLKLHYDATWRDEAFDNAYTQNATLLANWMALDPGNTDPAEMKLNNQTQVVWAKYDSATVPDAVQLSLGDSDSASSTFKADATNEAVSHTAFVPADATTVEFSFGYLNSSDDWWWAIDNLELTNFAETTSIWSEDFEGVTLGDSVNERQSTVGSKVTANNDDPDTTPRPNSFTHTAPAGWTTSLGPDMVGTPALDPVPNNNIGSFDLEAWSFMDTAFHTFVDGQGREDFTKADGSYAVADGDEWDDLGNPDASNTNPLQVLMQSPVIDLLGNAEVLKLTFDSSWRQEGDQEVIITADFGGGPVVIMHWESSDGNPANFHDDNTNESVVVKTDIPGGATTVQLEFEYRGFDDWWWAVDNIAVSAVPEPTSLVLVSLGLLGIGVAGRRRS
jgi:hypothetical protein